jgi:hypothetical protein
MAAIGAETMAVCPKRNEEENHMSKRTIEMLLALAAAALPLLPTAEICAQSPVTVQAVQQWQHTGIQIAVGNLVRITASGYCYCTTNQVPSNNFDPDGCCAPPDLCTCPGKGIADGTFLVPGVPRLALVGRVGMGAPFFVGDTLIMVSSGSGELELAFNDAVSLYWDNAGQYEATVTVGATMCTFPLANPGFELDTAGWFIGQDCSSGNALVDNGFSHSGGRSAKMFLRTCGGMTSQTVREPFPAGSELIMSFWLNQPFPGSHSNKFFTADIVTFASGSIDTAARFDRFDSTLGWEEHQVAIVLSRAADSVAVRLRTTDGVGSNQNYDQPLWVDDVTLWTNCVCGTPLLCPTWFDRGGDINCDGVEDVFDVVWLIDYVFSGGLPAYLPCPRK